jgi:predicted RNA-binding protein associated with RNAse of E/G family
VFWNTQLYLETDSYKGHISLLKITKVTEPLHFKYNDNRVCIVDDGIQQFPSDKHHSVTTMFDAKGRIIQWYIDICYMNGFDEENVPWMDDLYLDIVVLPTGEVILKDADELEEALRSGTINKSQYDLAKREAGLLISQVQDGKFTLMELSEEHKDLLLKKLQELN